MFVLREFCCIKILALSLQRRKPGCDVNGDPVSDNVILWMGAVFNHNSVLCFVCVCTRTCAHAQGEREFMLKLSIV